MSLPAAAQQQQQQQLEWLDSPHVSAEVAQKCGAVWAQYHPCPRCWQANRRSYLGTPLVGGTQDAGCPCCRSTADAAGGGHLECMKWWHADQVARKKPGQPLLVVVSEDDDFYQYDPVLNTVNSAAAGGHLECLKYAHENGYPWGYGSEFAGANYNPAPLPPLMAPLHVYSTSTRTGVRGVR